MQPKIVFSLAGLLYRIIVCLSSWGPLVIGPSQNICLSYGFYIGPRWMLMCELFFTVIWRLKVDRPYLKNYLHTVFSLIEAPGLKKRVRGASIFPRNALNFKINMTNRQQYGGLSILEMWNVTVPTLNCWMSLKKPFKGSLLGMISWLIIISLFKYRLWLSKRSEMPPTRKDLLDTLTLFRLKFRGGASIGKGRASTDFWWPKSRKVGQGSG